jgi:hypothetical protein
MRVGFTTLSGFISISLDIFTIFYLDGSIQPTVSSSLMLRDCIITATLMLSPLLASLDCYQKGVYSSFSPTSEI